MKKISSLIIGFVLICIGIAALAGQIPVLGIHPAVWFILGVGLMLSDSAWERLARAKRDADDKGPEPEDGATDDADSPCAADAIGAPAPSPHDETASEAKPSDVDDEPVASSANAEEAAPCADAAPSAQTSPSATEATAHKD